MNGQVIISIATLLLVAFTTYLYIKDRGKHTKQGKHQCIPHNPYIYRKRNKDENLRELIYKGYTIPFEIDTTNHKIVILGIFNQNLWN